MASLAYVQPHIDAIHAKAVALDVPSPVIDALQELLHGKLPSQFTSLVTYTLHADLNTPKPHTSALRPVDIISALSSHSTGKHNSLFSSREHQDAQELFQLLSECIKDETVAVDKEGHRDHGLNGLSGAATQDSKGAEKENIGNVKSVFDGLTANRRSCMECGYTEAVMHFPFDNWQLAVPRMTVSVDWSLWHHPS
jgi:ubiquitin carboxyl-terminal hydrolase 1